MMEAMMFSRTSKSLLGYLVFSLGIPIGAFLPSMIGIWTVLVVLAVGSVAGWLLIEPRSAVATPPLGENDDNGNSVEKEEYLSDSLLNDQAYSWVAGNRFHTSSTLDDK
jgi:hypothetical protein